MTTLQLEIVENRDYKPGTGSSKFEAMIWATNGVRLSRASGSTKGIAAGRAMRRYVEKEGI